MSTAPKGWPTQEKEERLIAQFTTIEPVKPKQYGLTTLANLFVYEVGTDAVEANSTVYTINATAHSALVGDYVRFTSGALSGYEVKVATVDTNSFTIAESLPSAPAAAVSFQILRHKAPLIQPDGQIPVIAAQAPIKFTLDGSDVTVNEDTVTPANNRPLPVKITSLSGPINITAGDLNVQLTHSGADYDSTRIGDGTNLLGITASNEAKVSLTTELPAGTQNIGDVDVVSSVLPTGAATSAKQDTGNTSLGNIDTSTASINGKLPATLGQKAMAASLAVAIASDQSAIPASQSGSWNIADITGTVSLPTGASTAAKQDTGNTSLGNIDGKLPATLGQKAMAASLAVVIASDQSAVPASQSGTWNIADITGTVSLPTGAATSAKQDTGNTSLGNIDGKLPSTLGQKTMANSLAVVLASDQSAIPVTSAALDVVDFLDTPVLDTSSTNIAGSASNPTQVVASLAANVKKVQFLDTTGAFIGLYTGAALSEVLQCVFGPGSDSTVEVSLTSGERVSLKRLDSATAISTGVISANFYG